MRSTVGALMAMAGAGLLALNFVDIGYGQNGQGRNENNENENNRRFVQFNCQGVDAECLVSEVPVGDVPVYPTVPVMGAQLPGVRIVRQELYPKRPAHYLSSNLYTTLAADRETWNQFCSFDFQVTPNGGGPDAHTHRNEWETFFVEQGNVTFTVELEGKIQEITVPPGTVVYGSQGPVHGFKDNEPGKPGIPAARIFSFALPCGLDNFFHTSGSEVVNFNARPLPPITDAEKIRTAFWAEQRGDGLFLGGPLPPEPIPGVISNINGKDLITGKDRPTETGPFGETRIVLLTEQEVGHITGATAFCGPGLPGRDGGSVKYSYFSMPAQKEFSSTHTSQNTEVFYTLGGTLSFMFTSGNEDKRVDVGPLTFIQIEPGVGFSVANLNKSVAGQSLAISVISPPFQTLPQPPVPPFPPCPRPLPPLP